MKKLLMIAAAVLAIATVNAQTDVASIKNDEATLSHQETAIKKEKREERKALRKLEGAEASYQAKEAFYGDFGNIPVTKWERTINFDKARFIKDGQEMTAYYDADSKLVGTTVHKPFSAIPAKAQKYINAKYSAYTKGDVIFFEDNELNETDMALFDNEFDDADNYFVPLKKDNKEIVLQVNTKGEVSFFREIE